MGINQNLSREAQSSYNAFVCISLSPWIPMTPISDKDPKLDKEWEENDYYCLNLNEQIKS